MMVTSNTETSTEELATGILLTQGMYIRYDVVYEKFQADLGYAEELTCTVSLTYCQLH